MMHTMESSIIGRYSNTKDRSSERSLTTNILQVQAVLTYATVRRSAVKREDLKTYLKSERELQFSRLSTSPLINLIVFSVDLSLTLLKLEPHMIPSNNLKNIS